MDEDTQTTQPTHQADGTADDEAANTIVSDLTQQAEVDDTTPAGMLMNLESMIKSHQLQIDQLTGEAKKHQEMIDDVFANDETYQKHVEEAKEVNKRKNAVRQGILNRPQVMELATKVKGMKNNLKELRSALSDYLREYQRLSGINEIEGYDGQIREIVYSAKLVRKLSHNQ